MFLESTAMVVPSNSHSPMSHELCARSTEIAQGGAMALEDELEVELVQYGADANGDWYCMGVATAFLG